MKKETYLATSRIFSVQVIYWCGDSFVLTWFIYTLLLRISFLFFNSSPSTTWRILDSLDGQIKSNTINISQRWFVFLVFFFGFFFCRLVYFPQWFTRKKM